MRIEPPADDYGVQRLRRKNETSDEVAETDHVEPYPRVEGSQERREREEQPAGGWPHSERRSGRERRQGERRAEGSESPYDTRTPRDRRVRIRRRADREPAERSAPPGGIDTKA